MLAAGAAAIVLTLFGAAPVQASGSGPTAPGVAPRAVNPSQLPKAGSTGQRILPRHFPRVAHTVRPASGKASTSAGPRSLQAAAAGGFAGDNLNQQTAAYPGTPFSDQDVVPPDNGTAVGSSFVVEFLNSSGWVYLRNNPGAGPVMSWDLNSFFIAPADQSAYSFSDPRIVWDPTSGRWFASGLSFAPTSSGYESKEYVAVSSTSDPTQAWTVYTVFSSTTGLGDQPRMGVTSDKVVEFWDFYPNSAAAPAEGYVIVNKANMLAGVTATAQTKSNSGWFGVVPAYDSSSADAWAVYNNTDPNLYSGCTTCYLGVVDISGAAGSVSVGDSHLSTTDPTYYAGGTTTAADLQAQQPGAVGGTPTSPYLDANDDRVTIVTIQGSTLWATANTACTSGTQTPVCVRMFKIATGAVPVLAQNTNISDSGGASLYFGAPTFDSAGDVTVGMTVSSATLNPSLAISGETASGSSFSAPTTVSGSGNGAGSYNDGGGFGDCVLGPPGTGTPCRWGDYNGAQPDVCDSTYDWVSTEYAAPPTTGGVTSNWGTWLLPVTFGTATTPANCSGAPTVSAVTPSSGHSGCVNVTGSGFNSAAHVYFGNRAAAFAVNGDASLTASVPSSATNGAVDVSVTNASGDSLTSSADQFTFTSSGTASCTPTVSSVTPKTGPLTGEQVVVGGAGFVPGTTTVSIAGNSAAVVTGSSSSLTVNLPAEPAGTYDVRASNGGAQSAVVSGDKFTYVDGGFTMDAYGGIHPFGVSTPPPAPTNGPSWNWKIARGMVVRTDRASGYVVDGWGGLHPFGSAPAESSGAYWPGWDIVRGIALDPCDSTGTSGYILDGWGGIHPFGHAASVSGYAYWEGWDIARAIVLNPTCGQGGYTLDGWGGIHPFATGGNAAPASPTGGAYWQGWDIARSLVLTGDGKGVMLDGWGGLHGFGGQATPAIAAYWPGWDIARSIATIPGVPGGYTLDGWGGVHPYGGAPNVSLSSYTAGSDIYRAMG